jgi:uncharacterized membrane protein
MSLHVVLPVATGIVLILIALPLLLRWIGPNRLYGLRVPATFADEWVWYEANAKSARDMCIVGLVLIVVPFALQAIPVVSSTAHIALAGTVTVTGIVVVAIVGWRRANRLLEQRRRT